jgi:glycerol kinase
MMSPIETSIMTNGPLLLSIDQGTTGTTVLLIDLAMNVHGRGYCEIPQSYPAPGLVEHDPEAIWSSVMEAFVQARCQVPHAPIAAIGITNQRETVMLWDRQTGQAVAPAIVWQDRRTAARCEDLKRAGHEPLVRQKTGLLIDPYFSATKIAWLLDHVPGLRARADAGQIAFGTVDSFLVWRLSGGRSHITDVSNASRTLLFDINTLGWSADLCGLFGVPSSILPRLCASAGTLAVTNGALAIPDGIPISGIAGDQQAALFGHGCLAPGDAKCTFGTGSFLLMNVGEKPVFSSHGLVGTVAWTTPDVRAYALEGSAFVSGALVQWLRDGLRIINSAAESETLAASVPDDGGITVVPALAGLGAPHWRPEARGSIQGISRGTTAGHIARAALQAMALQNVDLVRAMEEDSGRKVTRLRVDGGASANNLLMQLQADLLEVDIERPAQLELTAVGAARLAARGAGLNAGVECADSKATIFTPRMRAAQRTEIVERWRAALART